MKPLIINRPGVGGSQRQPDELELVSTQMLKQILTSRQKSDLKAVQQAANGATDGILVRARDGHYEVLADDEFERLIGDVADLPQLSRPRDVTERPLCDYAESGRFSLVTSRALRRVLSDDEAEADTETDAAPFDPYRRD